MDNESDVVELNKEFIDDYNSEIDPFASEKEESESESCYEDNDSETCVIEDTFTETCVIDQLNCSVIVPMMSDNSFVIEILFPFTISELFEKLKEEHSEIFDSTGDFIGRVYHGNVLLETNSQIIESELPIVLIHDLITEMDEIEEEKEEIVSETRSKATFMSKFRNFRNLISGKDKEKDDKEKVAEVPVFEGLKLQSEFVGEVLNYLRRDEMVQEGLFRLSGTFTRIKSLQDRLLSGETFQNLNLPATDCHNVTGLLKQYFRNLPVPLLTFGLYEAWEALGEWTGHPEIAVKIANFLVNQLPQPNVQILKDLMKFLHERLEDSEVTRMNACNYGTVIGPNLLWHPQEDRQTRDSTTLGLSLQSSTLASQICTLFLQHYMEIFEQILDLSDAPVMAYGRVLYDWCESDCDCDSSESEGDCNSSESECEFESDDCESESENHENSESDSCDDCEKSTAENCENRDNNLKAGQVVFITGIDDSFAGWWLAYLHAGPPTKFPSNYVQVVAQRSDNELIKIF